MKNNKSLSKVINKHFILSQRNMPYEEFLQVGSFHLNMQTMLTATLTMVLGWSSISVYTTSLPYMIIIPASLILIVFALFAGVRTVKYYSEYQHIVNEREHQLPAQPMTNMEKAEELADRMRKLHEAGLRERAIDVLPFSEIFKGAFLKESQKEIDEYFQVNQIASQYNIDQLVKDISIQCDTTNHYSKEHLQSISQIIAEACRACELIDEIDLYAKAHPEADTMHLQSQQAGLRELVESTINTIRSYAKNTAAEKSILDIDEIVVLNEQADQMLSSLRA